jgi:hypothetical protein
MAELADPLLKAAPAKAGESITYASGSPDRRKPGRLEQMLEQISTDLSPLLRTETAQYVDASDSRAPARGIVVGLLLSALLWALVGLAVIL